MKKLNETETLEAIKKFSSRGTVHPIIEAIEKLNVGESLFLKEGEWDKKTSVRMYLGNYKLRRNIKFSTRTLKGEGILIIKQ